jgi:imidazolonepropionase-like amidohydrolase
VKDAGAKLVWSPQSNLRLYGDTTPAATALTLGVPMGIGADWLPSGSPSTLHELQVARRTLARQGATPEPRTLVEMATSGAAAIAGLSDHLGQLAAGRVADVLVLERLHDDPYESILRCLPVNVSLVTIGGDLAYGRSDWLKQLTDVSELEAVLAWGDAMTLDTTYTVRSPRTPDRLRDLRAKLLARFPRTGPIFA